ncbi:Crp/Fnr family transcriptional regulator [Aureimonas jatrophae]|uniref:cAMP-binding domain of CRP or a regulatory subunit of cAMP-dependent protein kinases n=1 Tax=Aureimonas jatrophae TaxID=1166073 RepID=A0A1H0F8B5_9HYPH|nr:Crp/Fnr family transcriptional regulator [Aureimonas jatrophae]MBB3950132.1 CRP-like cAMP-binding protein [Aureimonas jatrophae]SDN90863.1 cAMP-binding domain of CRP or a regulatory subunit of cAMP-dependent protein kinases [Aureimonas jatrophae]
MKPVNDNAQGLLALRLSAHLPFGRSEHELLTGVPWRTEEMAARHAFIREGDRPTHSCLIVRGIVVRSQYGADGQRQILSVHIPGDMPDLQSLHIRSMDHDIETVSAARIAFVTHDDLRRLCDASAHLAAALWRESLIDAALFRAAIFRNAQLGAEARLAHFLCEMQLRHAAVDLVIDGGFDFPMSQELIGEVLGLTVVSINKAAQALRAQNLIRMEKGRVVVLDWDGLVRFGQFDGSFLHMEQPQRPLAAAS